MSFPPAPSRTIAGGFAFAFAMVAFAAAFLTDWGAYLNQPVEKSLTERAAVVASETATGIKERVLDLFEDEPLAPVSVPAPPDVDWSKRGKAASVLAAVLAILFASVGFTRREDARVITVALALAASALAYHLAIKGLIALAAGLLVMAIFRRVS